MKHWKRLTAVALAMCLLGGLVSCGGGGLTEKDAETYVKGHLDAAYLGTYDQAYIDLVEDMDKDDAKAMHEQNISDEAEILLDYFVVEYVDDALAQRAQAVVEEIYSHSQYKVGSASKTKDGDFVVEVTVSPIEVLELVTEDDFLDALDASGYGDAVTEDEMNEAEIKFGMKLMDMLESVIPDLTYGKDQVIMLQLKLDDEGYYNLVDTGMQTLDACIIDYTGSYTN